jgi:thioredoxin 1
MNYGGSILALTDATIDDFLQSASSPTLIDFWAKWCGPCKTLTPVLQSIAKTTPDMTVASIDVDANPESVAAYGITSIPTIILVRDGGIVKRIVGAKDKSTLLAELGAVVGD